MRKRKLIVNRRVSHLLLCLKYKRLRSSMNTKQEIRGIILKMIIEPVEGLDNKRSQIIECLVLMISLIYFSLLPIKQFK